MFLSYFCKSRAHDFRFAFEKENVSYSPENKTYWKFII